MTTETAENQSIYRSSVVFIFPKISIFISFPSLWSKEKLAIIPLLFPGVVDRIGPEE